MAQVVFCAIWVLFADLEKRLKKPIPCLVGRGIPVFETFCTSKVWLSKCTPVLYRSLEQPCWAWLLTRTCRLRSGADNDGMNAPHPTHRPALSIA